MLHVADGVLVEDDDGLAEECTVLRAAERQDVHADGGGERPHRDVQRRGGVGYPGPVEMDLHAPRVGVLADRADLVRRVERAELGALGDGDDLRHRPVLVVPAPRLPVDQLGRELAVRRRHGEQLEPAHPLGRAALVDVDVRGLGADHRAPAVGDRLKRNHIRAGAVEDREGLGGSAEVVADDPLQVLGVHVVAVRDLVPAVGQGQSGQHLGVGSRVVVTSEAANIRVVMTPGIGLGRILHRQLHSPPTGWRVASVLQLLLTVGIPRRPAPISVRPASSGSCHANDHAHLRICSVLTSRHADSYPARTRLPLP